MTSIHFHNYLRVLAVVVKIVGKNTIGYFGNVYNMSIPDPKNKQNEYTFPGDCKVRTYTIMYTAQSRSVSRS